MRLRIGAARESVTSVIAMRNNCCFDKLVLSWLGLAAAALLWTTGCGSDSKAGAAVERSGEPAYQFIKPDDKSDRQE